MAISSLICSARLCGPHSPTTQSSAYRMYLTRIKFGSHTSTAGIDRICRIRSRHSFVSALLRFARSCFWAESCLWSGLGRFFLPEVSRCRISSIFSSSSWRYTLASIGLAMPPWGVPARLSLWAPRRSRYPARRSFQMRLIKRSSLIFLRSRLTRVPCSISSKQACISPSMNQFVAAHFPRISCSAVWQLRFGLNP